MSWRALTIAGAILAAGCTSDGGRVDRSIPSVRREPASSTVTTGTATTTSTPPIASVCGSGPYPTPWAQRPRYRADVTIDPARRSFTGTVDVTFTPDAPTDHAVFRLWTNGVLPGRAGGRMTVVEAAVDGRAVAGSYTAAGAAPNTPGTVYSLPFGRSVAAGTSVALHVAFDGRIPGPTPDRIATVGSNIRLGSAIPVLSWVRGDGWQVSPAVDALAEAAATEVADWDVTVHVAPGIVVLATGDETTPNRFVAVAVRDFALTAGRLRVASATAQGGRTTVVAGVGEGASEDPAAVARRTASALDAMAAHFGAYPYDRLTIAVTPGLRGGIEFPMHIQLGSGIASRHLVHEVGHQWFYGLVGNDQYRDPWLDEGLTNYAEARVDGRVAGDRALAVPAGGAGKTGLPMSYWVAHRDIYFRSVYVQGTQALGALADQLGGYGALDCALARYVRDQAYAVARPANLATAVQHQSGSDPRPVLRRFGIVV